MPKRNGSEGGGRYCHTEDDTRHCGEELVLASVMGRSWAGRDRGGGGRGGLLPEQLREAGSAGRDQNATGVGSEEQHMW